MPSSTIFRQHTRLKAATNKTTKKISHTRRSPKDRNYPSTPFDKLPKIGPNHPLGDRILSETCCLKGIRTNH
ncbi:hypothetical protein FIU75_11980 [Lactobacillus buchneri]|nr:hypothetical protein [Lentilactobacillus buchneri]